MKKVGIFLFIMWAVRIIAIGLVVLMLLGGVVMFNSPKEAPKAEDARYAIQTYTNNIPSRIYFTNEMRMEGNIPIAMGYWSFNGKDYKHTSKEKEFPPDDYSTVTIIDRRNG